MSNDIRLGSVVQIVDMPETHRGWVGAFVLVTEVTAWGVKGFVHALDGQTKSRRACTRLRWDQFVLIGPATMLPAEIAQEEE